MSDIDATHSLFKCGCYSILRLSLRKLIYPETLGTPIQRKMFNDTCALSEEDMSKYSNPQMQNGGELTMAKDPVCGMMVDEKTAKIKSQYRGKTYYFCAQGCKITFDKNPVKFAASQ
jgi:YHS domain-containing protein